MLKSLIASIAVALAAATPAFASIEWQFTTADNPATPEIGDPSATASITVGDFGTGWQDISGLGSATGCWDLGMNGSVTLTIPNLASPISAHNATLSIVQWVDDFLFTGSLLYSVSGATQVGGTTTHLIEHPDPAGAPGEWVQYDTVWNLLASASPTTITINGPVDGAIFDRISVVPVVPEPTTIIAGALLLLPFGASTLRVLRRNRIS